MKCQDILQNELHEKYILDQLEGSEKEKYESHLKECKDCRAELENQRTLISGIREAGLAEMKNEIKRQVEIDELNHPGMTWSRLSKIAAVLFIFVLTPGVIIYLSKSNPKLVPTAEQKLQNAPKAMPYSEAGASTEGRQDIMPTEMTPDADLKVLKIPRQTDARGNRLFKKNESRKEVSTFKDEKEDAVLKSDLAGTLRESQPKRQIDDLIEPTSEVVTFSSSENRGARTYVYEAPEASLKKKSQTRQQDKLMFDIKNFTEQAVSDMRFVSNGHVVLIHLKTSADEAAREILARAVNVWLPKSFAVEIITQDSLNLEMNWLAGLDFLKIKPEEIKLEISSGQNMRVLVGERIYQIDLSKKSTEAVLVD